MGMAVGIRVDTRRRESEEPVSGGADRMDDYLSGVA